MAHAEAYIAMRKNVWDDRTGKSDTDDAFGSRRGWLSCVYRAGAGVSAPALPLKLEREEVFQ